MISTNRAADLLQPRHSSTLSSIQMMPVIVAIVCIARCVEVPDAISSMYGSIMFRGESKRVIMNGAPTGLPPMYSMAM